MLRLFILLLVYPVLGARNRTLGARNRTPCARNRSSRTPDPYIINGVDYRPYKLPPIETSHFIVYNDNPIEILVSNVSIEMVKKYPKTFYHVVNLEDVFVDPYKSSNPYQYDYMLGKSGARNRWRITVECNHTGYAIDPVWLETETLLDRFDNSTYVNITVSLQQGVVSFKRPWRSNFSDHIVYAPIQGLGIITTKEISYYNLFEINSSNFIAELNRRFLSFRDENEKSTIFNILFTTWQ